MPFRQVRKFVVDFFMLDFVHVQLYSAMLSPTDQIFFQDRGGEDWQLLDANTTRHEIGNASKYQWQLRFVLNSMMAAGASLLNSWTKQGFFAR